jgi:hypothetical protein
MHPTPRSRSTAAARVESAWVNVGSKSRAVPAGGTVQVLQGPREDTDGIGHPQHLVDVGGSQSEQHAPRDVDLLQVIERGGVRHESSDVLAGCGVGNDANRAHAWQDSRPGGPVKIRSFVSNPQNGVSVYDVTESVATARSEHRRITM